MLVVINRDGTSVKFNRSRIEIAVEKALHACTNKDTRITKALSNRITILEISKEITDQVIDHISNIVHENPSRYITVELIQDVVERVLMKNKFYTTAKEYILYRAEHSKIRESFKKNIRDKSLYFDHISIIKRNGNHQLLSQDKILKRIRRECEKEPVLSCDINLVAEKVFNGIHNNITSDDLDNLLIRTIIDMIIYHLDYDSLASRIAISRNHKNTDFNQYKEYIPSFIYTQFGWAMHSLYHNRDQKGVHSPLIKKELYDFIIDHQEDIEKVIDYSTDYYTDFFGFKTLEKTYLMRSLTSYFEERKITERIQDMWMRVSLGIHCTRPNTWNPSINHPSLYEIKYSEIINDNDIAEQINQDAKNFVPGKEDLAKVFETYKYMSMGYFTHATPTLIYSGTMNPCLSSCFLLAMNDDSIDGIYKTLRDVALISKNAGGIGFHLHNVRGNESYIRGTAGESNGIVPMLRVYDSTSLYVDQGGGKRKGAFAGYLELWHIDIYDFLELKLPHGIENKRARALFYGVWRCDYFMECVAENKDWYLMCPDECPGLADVHNQEFVTKYLDYVSKGKYRKVTSARKLYTKILQSRAECGVPYIGEKDAVNRKSNQKNLGTIKSSNLCVSGDTKILTSQGNISIKTLKGQKVHVWNGEEWSEVEIFQTGKNKSLLRIECDDGGYLQCTPEHKFYLKGQDVPVDAKELHIGDKLLTWSLPKISQIQEEDNSSVILQYPFTSGYQCGENNVVKDCVDEWSKKVPLETSNLSRWRWFEGFYFGSRGHLIENNTMLLKHQNKSIMFDLRLMLQSMGVWSCLQYDNNINMWILEIDVQTMIFENFIHLNIDNQEHEPKQTKSVKISGIYKGKDQEDTYCFREPIRHMGVFNGILTGQCTEIVEYSDPYETAVCNLSSICLPKFIKVDEDGNKHVDHDLLFEITKIITKNLNKVIDRTIYPIPETERSNYRHRPIGIGVQGLWDMMFMLDQPFDSEEAIQTDREVFETIYYASLTASMELAIEKGPYSSFRFGEGSPLSKGLFQFDMWELSDSKNVFSGRWNWDELRKDIMEYGVRNSELIAPMPTASTSQILGNIFHNNTECIEPLKSNLYKRKTTAGEFLMFNKHLMKDISEYNLDITKVRQHIESEDGSVQTLEGLPEHRKKLYKIVWELDQKSLIDHCAARSIFVTQACSMNLYLKIVDPALLTELDFYCWSKGIKTQYYTHSKSATKAKQHHHQNQNQKTITKTEEGEACTMEEGCLMCGS